MPTEIRANKPVLATDLDGTLIPLRAPTQTNHASRLQDACVAEEGQTEALKYLCQMVEEENLEIIFVTGRHQSSAVEVIEQESLPTPQWIICDVGTTIMRRDPNGGYSIVSEYVNHVDKLTGGFKAPELANLIQDVASLKLQEPENQSVFKLSYYCSPASLDEASRLIERRLSDQNIPYAVTSSIDLHSPRGMIDLLPLSIHKGTAVQWWAQMAQISHEEIIYAGDSGNDLAALTAGFRSIVVGNAEENIVKMVKEHHRKSGTLDRFHHASTPATAGVLEGLRRMLAI